MSLFLDSVSASRKIRLVNASGIGNRPVHVVGNNFYTINNFNYPVVSSDGGISWNILTVNPPLNLQFRSIGHSNLDIFYKQDTLDSNNVFALSELSRAAALNVSPIKISNWSGNTLPQSGYSWRRFIYDGDFISAKSFWTDTNLQRAVLYKQLQSGSQSGFLDAYSPDLNEGNCEITKSLTVEGGIFQGNQSDFLGYRVGQSSTRIRLSQATDGVLRKIYPWTLCEADTSSSAERGLACVFASDANGGNRGIYRIYKDNIPGGNVPDALTTRPRIEFVSCNYPSEFQSLNATSTGGSSFKITEDGKIYATYNTNPTPSTTRSKRWISQSFGSDWTQLPGLSNLNHTITTLVEDSFKISTDGRNQIIRTSLGLFISTNYGY